MGGCWACGARCGAVPVDSEDRYFGASEGSANKALSALIKQYGARKGHDIYYRMLAERKKAGRTYGARKAR